MLLLQGGEEEMVDDNELRKLSKIMTARAISKSVVSSEFPFLNLLFITDVLRIDFNFQ